MSELVNPKEYGKFFDEILGLDPKIRSVGIYDGKYHAKFKNQFGGLVKDEEIKFSFSEAKQKWEIREQMDLNAGEPRFTMSQRGKINRLVFSIGKDGIVVITTELYIDANKLVDKIVAIRGLFQYNLTSFFIDKLH